MVKVLLLAGTSRLFASSAMAQAAAPAAAPVVEATDEGLEEIVVTAQKREQRLQTVPVSVTALSADAIANNRLADFSDLTRVVPSMTITQTTSAPNNSIILRGIGTFAFSIGVEPSVAVLIDDMPVVQQAQAFDNLADLQRIEVLMGPQGTLFGKNSSAGVVNIVTKDPGNELEGNASVSLATDGDVRLEGVLSAPLADGVGLRVTGFFHDFPGNVRNLTTGTRLNDQQNYGIRAKLKAQVTDTLTMTLTGAYSKAVQDGTGTTIRAVRGTGTPRVFGNAALPLLPSLTGITPGEGNYNARVDALGATRNETASVQARFALDLGFADLIAISAYQDWRFNFQNDFDGTDLNVLGALTGGAVNGGVTQSGPYKSGNFTQEVRLVSGADSPVKYIVGGFYSNARTDRAFVRGPVVAPANWSARNVSESIALFAQLDYTLPTKTTISGGVRYNHERITVAFDNLVAGATANQCATGNALCRGQNSDSVVTWKLSVGQELAPAVLLYASAASGYKGFAYDITTGFNPARINGALNGTGAGLLGVGPVQPETSIAWEAGIKSRFLDNKVQLNVIAFQTDYDNFQAQSAILLGTPPAPQFVLNNVGKLRTRGFEVELSAKAADWLRIDAGATYADAIMQSFPQAQGFPGQTGQLWNGTASALVGPCVAAAAATAAAPRTTCSFQDRSGARLPNSPQFKWSIGATADFPVTDDVKALATLSYQHQSSVNFDLLGNPDLVQKPYGIVNASLGAEFGRVKLVAFVNNLFNQHYAASMADGFGVLGGSASNDTHVVYQFQPRDSWRYAGIKLSVGF